MLIRSCVYVGSIVKAFALSRRFFRFSGYWAVALALSLIAFPALAAQQIPGLPPPEELATQLKDEILAGMNEMTPHIIPAIAISLIIRKLTS